MYAYPVVEDEKPLATVVAPSRQAISMGPRVNHTLFTNLFADR